MEVSNLQSPFIVVSIPFKMYSINHSEKVTNIHLISIPTSLFSIDKTATFSSRMQAYILHFHIRNELVCIAQKRKYCILCYIYTCIVYTYICKSCFSSTNSVTLIISAHSVEHLSKEPNTKCHFHNSFDLTRIWNSLKGQHIQTTINVIHNAKSTIVPFPFPEILVLNLLKNKHSKIILCKLNVYACCVISFAD